MNLGSDMRLKIQLRLDFSSAPTGEARQAGREEVESLLVVREPERPANTSRTMEEVCERFKSLALSSLVEARWRNFSNRRVRTRTHGGVGGAEPRGSPLSRSLDPKRKSSSRFCCDAATVSFKVW
jgi:hypothetical protein